MLRDCDAGSTAVGLNRFRQPADRPTTGPVRNILGDRIVRSRHRCNNWHPRERHKVCRVSFLDNRNISLPLRRRLYRNRVRSPLASDLERFHPDPVFDRCVTAGHVLSGPSWNSSVALASRHLLHLLRRGWRALHEALLVAQMTLRLAKTRHLGLSFVGVGDCT